MFTSTKDYQSLFKDYEFLNKKISPDGKKKLLRSSSQEEGEAVWQEIDTSKHDLAKEVFYRNMIGQHLDKVMKERLR